MLRILPRYFVRELLKTFAYAFVAVLLIIFLAFVLQMMLTKGLNIFKMPKVVPYLLLLAFPYALPTALLASVIMTYGRFAGDNEILAIRSSGIHLQWITTPTVMLGTLCCFFSLFVSGNLLPATEAKLKSMEKEEAIRFFVDQMGGLQQASIDLPGWEVYIRSQDGDQVKDVLVFKTENEQVTEVIKGKKGLLKPDKETGGMLLELEDVDTAHFTGNDRDLQWIHCEKGVVPLPRSRSKENLNDRPKYMWLLDLFRKQKELDQKVLTHEEIYPKPTEVLRRLNKERAQLQNDISAKLQEMKDVTRDRQRYAEAAQKAKQEAEASARGGEALQSKLRQMEDDRKAIAPKQEAIKAEKDKKAQELKRLKEPVQIEPSSPESLVLADRLDREIKGLDADVERLKEAGAKLDGEIAQAQGDIKAVKANTQAQQQFADTCVKEEAEQKQKADAITNEKAELDAAFKDTERLRLMASEQKLAHEVRCIINDRMALAFSPLAFVLIAIPLGIMCRHGHILVGFSIGIGLLLGYYAVFMVGRVLAQGRYFYVEPSYWAADALLSAIGILLLMNIYKR